MSIPEELERREIRLEAIAKAKREIEHRAEERYEKEKAEIYEMKMSINENQIIYPREAQRVNDVSSSLWLNGLENSNGLSDAQVYIKNFVGDAVLSLE